MLPSDFVHQDRAFPPRDREGKVELHKMGLLTWLRAVPSLLRFFDGRVPEEFWAEQVDEDGNFEIIVSCPCGAEPKLSFGGMTPCECDRSFMHDGKEVRVGREIEPPVVN